MLVPAGEIRHRVLFFVMRDQRYAFVASHEILTPPDLLNRFGSLL
jgi:hypothetical protein